MINKRSGTWKRQPGLILATAMVLAELWGCGLFDIRDPVSPVRPSGPPFANPIAPESVLFNITHAVRYKIDGLGQYTESLADSFQLVLDVLDAQELGVGFDSLAKTVDVSAQRIRSQEIPDSFYFSFGTLEPTERTGTTAFYLDNPYELQLLRREGDSLSVVQTIRGKAELSLAEIQAGKWVLLRWVDEREDPFESFGRWHGERAVSQAPRARP